VSNGVERLQRVGILRPLGIRDFALLWTGMTVSMIGDGIYVVAIAWQIYELSNSPTALAMVGLAWTLPQVLFVVAGGVLADRLDRRLIMVAGDVIRCLAIGTLGGLSLAGDLTVPLAVAIVVVYGVGQAVFQPAFHAIVPTIVPEDLLVEANSLAQFVRPVAMTLLGPLTGGLLIGAVGTGWAFVADGASFAFSAAMILLMRVHTVPRDPEARPSMFADVAEGFRYVRDNRWLLVAMVAATVSLLATWGPWETLVPFVVKNDLGGTASDLGLVFGAGGVGAVTAALVMGQRGKLPRRAVTSLYVAWAIGMFGTAGFGIVTSIWQAMLVALVAEAAITVLVVIWLTLVQQLVDPRLLGRVVSLDWMISTAGVPLSFAITGPLASSIGVDATLIWAGVLGAAVTLAFLFVPGARGPERDGSLATADRSAAQG
jgi:transmembrane secretion effector